MKSLANGWGLSLCLMLTACASSAPTTRAESGEEGCEEDACVTFLCDEEACGVYRCEDVDLEPVLLAYKGGIAAPPGNGPRRNWGRRQGAPGDGLPIFVIPWRFHDRREQVPGMLEALQLRIPIKHHLFPQQPELARWFKRKGINIHRFTMVLEKDVHDRLHRGADGGPWNAAWREFVRSNDAATEAEIWQQAIKLVFRFEIAGPIVPYHLRLRPPSAPRQER